MKTIDVDTGSMTGGDRGRRFGQQCADQIATAIALYHGHFRDLGIPDEAAAEVADAAYLATCRWDRGLGAELAAVAEGARVPLREVCLLNARTEVLALARTPGEGECSTAVRLASPPVTPLAFQTWDWHAHLAPTGVLWRTADSQGRWVKTFTEPGVLAKIGMNSAGLSANFNILHHDSDAEVGAAAGGVPVHLVVRSILDRAATVQEALAIARSAPVTASSVITVVATGGGPAEAGSIEISPAGTALVRPGPDGWLLHTNHFLDPDLATGDLPYPGSTTRQRYTHLERVTSVIGDAADGELAALAGQLCGAAGSDAPICMASDPALPAVRRWNTLLTVLLHPAEGVVEYWPGSPAAVAEAGRAQRF